MSNLNVNTQNALSTIKALLVVTLFLPTLTFAQSSSDLGIKVGATNYLGDLAPDGGSFDQIGFGGGVTAGYMFNKKIGLRANILFAKYKGSDATVERNQFRDWSMETDLIETSIVFEYHPLGQARRDAVDEFNKHQISPFGFIGIGGAFGTAMVTAPEENKDIFPEDNAASSFLVVPMGLGIRYDINSKATLSLEYGLRAVLSDQLDGVSKNGNASANDWYGFTGISFTMSLHSGSDENID